MSKLEIAISLQHYNFSFQYFREEYCRRLSLEVAKEIWNTAKKYGGI